MSVITRQQWGARPPTSVTESSSFRGVAVHWEGPRLGWPWAHALCFEKVRGIQNFHMDTRGWADIAYNLVVCGHGDIFVGRGPNVRNAANGGLRNDNGEFYAICYLGGEGDAFTLDAKDGINDGAEFLSMAQGVWRRHSDFVATSCPGPVIAEWVANGHPRGHPIVEPEVFLMALSPEEQNALLAMTRATNDEVAKLAIVIRDQTTGMAVQIATIRAEVAAIKAKIGA